LVRGPVRSLRLCRPLENVVEAAAVTVIAGRVRAVAARLELEAGGGAAPRSASSDSDSVAG
jgi:hypothetical protein